MKKSLTCTLYWISGILFAISSILNFNMQKTWMGITYLCLAVTFISLGFAYKKKNK